MGETLQPEQSFKVKRAVAAKIIQYDQKTLFPAYLKWSSGSEETPEVAREVRYAARTLAMMAPGVYKIEIDKINSGLDPAFLDVVTIAFLRHRLPDALDTVWLSTFKDEDSLYPIHELTEKGKDWLVRNLKVYFSLRSVFETRLQAYEQYFASKFPNREEWSKEIRESELRYFFPTYDDELETLEKKGFEISMVVPDFYEKDLEEADEEGPNLPAIPMINREEFVKRLQNLLTELEVK